MNLTRREKQVLLEILMQLKWDTNQAEVALEVKQISIKIQESLKQTEEVKPVEEVIEPDAEWSQHGVVKG